MLITTIDASNARKALKSLQFLSPVVIWVRPPSIAALSQRLRNDNRGAAAQGELESRLASNEKGHRVCEALWQDGKIDFTIVNEDLATAVTEMEAVGEAVRPLLGCFGASVSSICSSRPCWHSW